MVMRKAALISILALVAALALAQDSIHPVGKSPGNQGWCDNRKHFLINKKGQHGDVLPGQWIKPDPIQGKVS